MNTERLKEIPLFEDLGDDALASIATLAQEVSVREGSTVVREGDYSYELTIIDEGSAEVRHDADVLATLGPGDVFGESGVLHRDLRNASVVATSPMRLITLTGWDLRRLRKSHPELNERLEQLAAERQLPSSD